MSAAQPIAVVALARRLNLTPAVAATLLVLYRTRYCRSAYRLATTTGLSLSSIKVYVSHIREALGNASIITDRIDGYTLTEDGRRQVRDALTEMYAEAADFIRPLLTEAA
jgi:hypothetical protein